MGLQGRWGWVLRLGVCVCVGRSEEWVHALLHIHKTMIKFCFKDWNYLMNKNSPPTGRLFIHHASVNVCVRCICVCCAFACMCWYWNAFYVFYLCVSSFLSMSSCCPSACSHDSSMCLDMSVCARICVCVYVRVYEREGGRSQSPQAE